MSAAGEPLLEIRGLRLETASGPLVDDVSCSMAAGRFTAVVGESGSGKTLLARSILRLLPPGVNQTAGSIRFADEPLESATPQRLRELRGGVIGMVFQEPMVSLNPSMTIGAQMAEAMRLHRKIDARALHARSVEMLTRVRIADPERCLRSYPHEFSGGMRQRIMLASVMLPQPRLLIADEPTTALDPLAQRDVLDLMTQIARASGTAVMLITHNLALVERYADDAIVLRRGGLVESGTVKQVLGAPRETYTRELVGALPRRTPRALVDRSGVPVLSAKNLQIAYPGRGGLFRRVADKQVLAGVSLDLFAGETVALVGGSGSGKTTLGRAMAGLITPGAGEICFRGKSLRELARATLREFRLASQMVFQDPYSSLNPRMRIAEIVAEPLRLLPELTRSERQGRVAQMLDEVGLLHCAQRFPHELSGGQRQRIAIARAIVRHPLVVIADEPISALDLTVQQQVLSLLQSLQQKHRFACLFITHDFAAVGQIADRIVVMNGGRLVEQGLRDEVLDRPQDPYTRELLAAAPSFDAAGCITAHSAQPQPTLRTAEAGS